MRARTRSLHEAAEAALDPDRRLATLETYADLLDRLWALHAGVAGAMEACSAADPRLGASARLRSDSLARDLQDVRGRGPRRKPPTFVLEDAHQALGAAYVTEGSALGGRVLHRRAGGRLGVSGSWGARFLAGDESRGGWRLVLDQLADVDPGAPAAAGVEAGARRTFEAFARALAEG